MWYLRPQVRRSNVRTVGGPDGADIPWAGEPIYPAHRPGQVRRWAHARLMQSAATTSRASSPVHPYKRGERVWVKLKDPGYWRRASEIGSMQKSIVVGVRRDFLEPLVEQSKCGRMESNHHSAGHRVYSAESSPMLSVRKRRAAGRIRTGTSRITTSDACRYTTATTKAGTTGLEPAAFRLTSDRSCR